MPKLNAKRYNLNAKFGFTLIEFLIASLLVLILSAAAVQNFLKNSKIKNNDAIRVTDINSIKLAAEDFYEKNGLYPPTNASYSTQTTFKSDTVPLGASDWIPELVPNYINQLPKDPKQIALTNTNLYLYYVSLDRKSYSLWAKLENASDPRIYNKPTAQCTASPPEPDFNYCGTF